jgi:hypothetical protein
MSLQTRLRRLERDIKPAPESRRVILVWVDGEGRLTKVTDSHPGLPDDTKYHQNLVADRCVAGPSDS